jgi:hypothetical protein
MSTCGMIMPTDSNLCAISTSNRVWALHLVFQIEKHTPSKQLKVHMLEGNNTFGLFHRMLLQHIKDCYLMKLQFAALPFGSDSASLVSSLDREAHPLGAIEGPRVGRPGCQVALGPQAGVEL